MKLHSKDVIILNQHLDTYVYIFNFAHSSVIFLQILLTLLVQRALRIESVLKETENLLSSPLFFFK